MKNIIENATNVIDIYGAESRDMSKSRDDQVAQFGRIVTFGDSCLVTYAGQYFVFMYWLMTLKYFSPQSGLRNRVIVSTFFQ